jgi:hypothetical protein
VTNRTDEGNRVSVEQLHPETVLEQVAEPPTELPLAGEWAVRTGGVATGAVLLRRGYAELGELLD